MLSFIGIWIWVWNGRHKEKYDALARMPMEDEPIEDEEAQP
jgi:cbb3-type cytochrome oxidase subunit 3